ncbi:NAD(P)H-dependent oxidoreductase [Streptomyces poriferorum]|uniref:NADPH-dependent FMN reductase n=1 Tax=Streptomyces poriferorum TaxID=2798799 RepID=UPI00273FBB4A|nr:NAD(P)H-dependent oxidoreductase [Streptomyces sp. Alt1]WLQ47253.1 NAD(P)H-dependent oxidoreductase [Streptomyces sp. Alt1]
MTRIGIVIGSTRPGRLGPQVAGWVHEVSARRSDAEFELVDLAEFRLPLFDQVVPPATGGTGGPGAQAWVRTVESLDGFVFVTPEYNGQLPAALKNAIDFVHAGWADKAAGIVAYGVAGGAGSAAQLRQLCGLLGLADVPAQVSLHLATDFDDFRVFAPSASRARSLDELLDRVAGWTAALEHLRSARTATIA